MMMNGRSSFPFTASQWQELEHQALIFKYMVSGIPVPPDLLITVKRSCSDSPVMSSSVFTRQPPHIGWNYFQMGLGRKIDPEPGRCRRTDGKKWRCSKEAYPDSKYCERHMHRGKNRSRKPVEVGTQITTSHPSTPTSISSIVKNSSTLLSSPSHSLSLLSSEIHHQTHPHCSAYHTHLGHHFLSSHTEPPGIGMSPHDKSSHLILDSGGSCSLANTDYRRNRNAYGLKEDADEHALLSEPSGSMRNLTGSTLDDAWQLTPLTMSSSSSCYSSKQRNLSSYQNECSYLQLQSLSDRDTPKQENQHQRNYLKGSDITCQAPMINEREEQQQKIVHRFFDEWPPKSKSPWLDFDDKSSITKTRLSISIPSSSHEFPISSSRGRKDA
ncbi:hypothetical protein K2173_016048 [Erythroxylum novogranatense]|uniref:Growth-regulating factor n=1 Tax=Erythroxylum novogranatense TaxID=1862640 RepID=A0AAV8SF65_9ROSI|nr:hypothetical protein K2173_016048 [Erythroxylum novogranatense]